MISPSMIIKKESGGEGVRCVEDRRRWILETPETDKILVPGRPFRQNLKLVDG